MKCWKILPLIAAGIVVEVLLFPVQLSSQKSATETALALAASPFIAGTSIPRLIHHTWKTPLSDSSRRIKRNVRDWDNLNPGFHSSYYMDSNITELVYSRFPERIPLYERLNAIQRADFFRYLVLFDLGGIYADVDVVPELSADEWVTDAQASHHDLTPKNSAPVISPKAARQPTAAVSDKMTSDDQTPLSTAPDTSATKSNAGGSTETRTHKGSTTQTSSGQETSPESQGSSDVAHSTASEEELHGDEIGCLIGVEIILPNQEVAERHRYIGPIQFTQWTIACSPRHPILLAVLDMIEDKVHELTKHEQEAVRKGAKYVEKQHLPTLETTGPFVWTRAIERYLNERNVSLSEVHRVQFENRDASVKVGDVLLLAPCKFGKNSAWPELCAKGQANFVQHEFMGSWKAAEYGLAKKVVLILIAITVAIVIFLIVLYRLCKHKLEEDVHEVSPHFLPYPLTLSTGTLTPPVALTPCAMTPRTTSPRTRSCGVAVSQPSSSTSIVGTSHCGAQGLSSLTSPRISHPMFVGASSAINHSSSLASSLASSASSLNLTLGSSSSSTVRTPRVALPRVMSVPRLGASSSIPRSSTSLLPP